MCAACLLHERIHQTHANNVFTKSANSLQHYSDLSSKTTLDKKQCAEHEQYVVTSLLMGGRSSFLFIFRNVINQYCANT